MVELSLGAALCDLVSTRPVTSASNATTGGQASGARTFYLAVLSQRAGFMSRQSSVPLSAGAGIARDPALTQIREKDGAVNSTRKSTP